MARDGLATSSAAAPGPTRSTPTRSTSWTADCETVTRTVTAPPSGGDGADDGLPPTVAVGAPTLQRLGRARRVRVYATSSERGTA